MQPSNLRTWLPWALLAALSIAVAVAATNVRTRKSVDIGDVVTLTDYFELGESSVARELERASKARGTITSDLAERSARAVVRVRLHHSFHGDSYSTNHATGVLVEGGDYVVTVAHELEVPTGAPDSRVEILLGDGRVFAGRIAAVGASELFDDHNDWALIEVVEPAADMPSLQFGAAAPGPRLVLGFPGRFGLRADGRAELDDPNAPQALRPLRILGTTHTNDPSHIALTAGCVPIGGISGAPCIDTNGRVVALQRAVTDTTRGGHTTSMLEVVSVDGALDALERLAKSK